MKLSSSQQQQLRRPEPMYFLTTTTTTTDHHFNRPPRITTPKERQLLYLSSFSAHLVNDPQQQQQQQQRGQQQGVRRRRRSPCRRSSCGSLQRRTVLFYCCLLVSFLSCCCGGLRHTNSMSTLAFVASSTTRRRLPVVVDARRGRGLLSSDNNNCRNNIRRGMMVLLLDTVSGAPFSFSPQQSTTLRTTTTRTTPWLGHRPRTSSSLSAVSTTPPSPIAERNGDHNDDDSSTFDQSSSLSKKNTGAAAVVSRFTIESELLTVRRQYDTACELYRKNMHSAGISMDQLQQRITDLEREQAMPQFWDESNNVRCAQVHTQLSDATQLRNRLQDWEQWSGDAQAALDMLQDSSSSDGTSTAMSLDEQYMLVQEFKQSVQLLLSDCQTAELEWLLSGPYDASSARMVITAGAGGIEANDWVADLTRMYMRYITHYKPHWTCQLIDYTTPTDGGGYKSVELLITGHNAYGWLQGEKGAHRLVRLSPFNANNKRQTTFAGVDVAPDVQGADALKLADITVPESELEITTMRSGGKGGQNVNKVSSAVRIKHLPSGITVRCTEERSQSQNKDIAMNRLKAQLLCIAQEQRVQEIRDIRGDIVEASWGAQIRNYVLHPYKLVKDQRTGWETTNPQSFLDGDFLDECIGSFLRYKAEMERDDANNEHHR